MDFKAEEIAMLYNKRREAEHFQIDKRALKDQIILGINQELDLE